jgi:hypothetical protein
VHLNLHELQEKLQYISYIQREKRRADGRGVTLKGEPIIHLSLEMCLGYVTFLISGLYSVDGRLTDELERI